jgi:hypothetical protein
MDTTVYGLRVEVPLAFDATVERATAAIERG